MLASLYHSYAHTCINYANIAWGSTHFTNLKNFIVSKIMQYAMYIISPNSNIQGTFSEKKILSVYQLSILNNVMFMHNISSKNAPMVFHPRFQRASDFYYINFSESN